MINLFQIIISSVVLCLMLSVSSYAGQSEIYDLYDAKHTSKSIAYKAGLGTPFSQLENWTDETISFKIAYSISQVEYFKDLVEISPTISIMPYHMLIFSPDDSEMKNYYISQVNINNQVVNVQCETGIIVQHVCFFSGASNRIIKEIQTLNINLAKKK